RFVRNGGSAPARTEGGTLGRRSCSGFMTQRLAEPRGEAIELRRDVRVEHADLGLEAETAARTAVLWDDARDARELAGRERAFQRAHVFGVRDDGDGARAARFRERAPGERRDPRRIERELLAEQALREQAREGDAAIERAFVGARFALVERERLHGEPCRALGPTLRFGPGAELRDFGLSARDQRLGALSGLLEHRLGALVRADEERGGDLGAGQPLGEVRAGDARGLLRGANGSERELHASLRRASTAFKRSSSDESARARSSRLGASRAAASSRAAATGRSSGSSKASPRCPAK